MPGVSHRTDTSRAISGDKAVSVPKPKSDKGRSVMSASNHVLFDHSNPNEKRRRISATALKFSKYAERLFFRFVHHDVATGAFAPDAHEHLRTLNLFAKLHGLIGIVNALAIEAQDHIALLESVAG